MKSDERYDAKEAYNKKLSSQARMHYLENDIADRKGHAGTYSGNHPRYSSPAGMMGQAKADLTYNPMDDIAGQGTEGVNTGMMMVVTKEMKVCQIETIALLPECMAEKKVT